MFTDYNPYLRMGLALTGLMFAQASAADTTSSANVFHPTDNCDLIRAIQTANQSLPFGGLNIIDLGGKVFEFADDCFTTASACPVLPSPTPPIVPLECYANDVNYSRGPTALPEITGNIQIVNGRIVRAAEVADVPNANLFRIITVSTDDETPANSGKLSLFKVTLENGNADDFSFGTPTPVELDSGNGGAVYVDFGTSLNLQNSKIGFNLADNSGGGIYVACGGTLDVNMSIISNNTANAEDGGKNGGGGIYLASGNCGVRNLANKKAPAVSTLGSLDSSTISHNTTPGLGGGLNNQGSAAGIFDSTFSYNLTCISVPGSGECGVGFNPTGAGGGIYNDSTASFLQITQSTFWANRALQGGGIFNEEARATAAGAGVYMNNNTIANNFTQLNGGGLYNLGYINQFVSNLVGNNTDFDANAAPDIWSLPNGVLTGFNYPSLPLDPPPTAPIIEGFNFVGDCGTTDQCQLDNDFNKDIIGGSATLGANIDPRLHDLEKKGGPTETVALYPDSPAVNNGFNNLGLAYDQRGPHFYRTVGQTDIGSFEFRYDL